MGVVESPKLDFMRFENFNMVAVDVVGTGPGDARWFNVAVLVL